MSVAQDVDPNLIIKDSSESAEQSAAVRKKISPDRAKRELTVVSWDLSDAVSAGVLHRRKQKKRVWRNTFVPRERVERASALLPVRVRGADVVLMQGVQSMREVRKLFPARDWKVIISRQYLKSLRSRRRGRFSREIQGPFATTAIAVRYRRGLRVTGQDHLLNLIEESVGPGDGYAKKETGVESSIATEEKTAVGDTQAGLAVRVYYDGKVLWFVSVAVANACGDDSSCDARKKLDLWIEDKRDYDIPVVVGGRLTARSHIDVALVTRSTDIRHPSPAKSPQNAASDAPQPGSRDAPQPGSRVAPQPGSRDAQKPSSRDAQQPSSRDAPHRPKKPVSRGFFSFFKGSSAPSKLSDVIHDEQPKPKEAITVEPSNDCVPHEMLFYPKREVVVEQDQSAGCFSIVTLNKSARPRD